jgi:LPS export ABC transporter permease LptF/LPS export ABC transporter permease LptG
MRILNRYILKEIFSHSLLGLLVFSFAIFVPHIGHLLELAVRHSLPLGSILTLFVLPIPGILVLTIPMSVLVGTLIGLSRMSADGEVIAVRASGIGLGQFVRPVMVFALAGWGLALWMSLFLAPQTVRELHDMEQEITTSEIPYEIQPRVFLEQFPNLLLYLQDVSGYRSRWRGVFIADTTHRDAPKVTLAESGLLVNDSRLPRLTLHLDQGTTQEIDPQHPERYSIASFTDTDIPIPLSRSQGATSEWHEPRALSLGELLKPSPDEQQRQAARVELHYRLALPVASLVLALVGIALGLSTRKGGKAMGVMLTILLVFVYYIIMAFGLSFAKQGRLDPVVGLWLANLCFGVAGVLMLSHFRRVRLRLQFLQEWLEDLWRQWHRRHLHASRRAASLPSTTPPEPRPPRQHFFQILDLYIMRGWIFYLLILLATFSGIYMIFDFFQILGDVVRNHIPARVVLDYYRFLAPQVAYLMLPLSVLMATLVSFGLLAKTNQITALKSAGISVYRAALPILVAAGILSLAMFLLGDSYLPQTNQRQDALRNQIKGKPAQTYFRPDRQWIFGQSSHIYNYSFFDPDQNVFAHLSVFELNPQTFELTRRIYATRAFWEPHIHGWVLENGWVRDLEGDRVTDYMPFSVATFKEIREEPSYFKKSVRPSAQMSALELRRYINELAQSGFNVVRLSVQFYRKFAFPLIAFVVALIGIPFSLSMGGKGAISGIALSIGIAIAYWSVSSVFEAMGNLNQLPPIVAAWSPDVLFGLGGVYLLLRVRT